MENGKRLYRSNSVKVIGGVCGGLADYLSIDVVLLRVAFVLLFLFGGSGVLVYVIMWIAIPAQRGNFDSYEDLSEKKSPDESSPRTSSNKNANSSMIAGIILIVVGFLFLADRLIPYSHIIDLWPLILVGFGVLLIKPEILRSNNNVEPSNKQE
ncbi:MAG: PspC domain-containing protein [Bacteroidetes bacterium]|nr:MAG: PspC domain-containing protein [Bacteroidota bacterium]